jgi:hypothetical protein
MKNIFYIWCAPITMLISGILIQAISISQKPKCETEFKILTDKFVYNSGSSVRVNFIVTNEGKAPFYIYRGLRPCSSPLGSYSFAILDTMGRDIQEGGCSLDSAPMEDSKLIEWITNPEDWIVLEPRESYGKQYTFDLPAKPGSYRLKAELIPTYFTEKQKEMLSQKGIRTLQYPCPASVVTITVK